MLPTYFSQLANMYSSTGLHTLWLQLQPAPPGGLFPRQRYRPSCNMPCDGSKATPECSVPKAVMWLGLQQAVVARGTVLSWLLTFFPVCVQCPQGPPGGRS